MSGHDQENPQDVRHMLNDALGVARRRRWWFVIPSALAALGALLYTFSYPRVYNARSLFERRDSLVISNLIRSYQYNPYAFSKLRRSIYVDLKGYKAVERAVEELGLDKDLPRDANGELTDEGRRWKQTMVNEFASTCEVYLQDKTDTRDLVSVMLPSKDPVVASALVTKLRDNYIKNAQGEMGKILSSTMDYWNQLVAEKRELVSNLEAELLKFRSQFKGLDPSDPEGAITLLSKLEDDKQELQRKIEELQAEILVNQEALGLRPEVTTTQDASVDVQANRPKLLDVAVVTPSTEPNPEYAEKASRIDALRDKTIEMRMTMTDEHPEVRRLNMKIRQLEEDLSRTPRVIPIDVKTSRQARTARQTQSIVTPEELILRQDRARARVALRNLEQMLDKTRRELDFTDVQLTRLQAEKSVILQRRQEYLRRQSELDTARADLGLELKRYNHASQLLAAEKNKRGIIFTVLEETQVSGKPVSPKVGRVLTIAIGFGLAIGLAVVLLLELLDRTFRSVSQVVEEVKLPVLQAIGEIVTPLIRRRRLAKQVVMHAIAVSLIGLVCLTSGIVYLSLEQPQVFERLKADPGLFGRKLIGVGLADWLGD
ncbi:MAG: hypothetical protein JXQ73_18340 [Phycisphaerae bacterium]|nr:hypothetical protein [Phycisphaerae bacterium]